MIMGYNALAEKMACGSASCVKNITMVTIGGAAFDSLYGSGIDPAIKPPGITTPPDNWDAATCFSAGFNGDTYCGNADFSVNNTTNILVKRRRKGEFEWFTLYDIPANKSEDYLFTVIDPYAPKGTLEYAAVPIINGYESDYSIAEITYDFDGILLLEKDKGVHTILDVTLAEDKNAQIGLANTVAGKYPFVFYNGENNYFTGTVSATFVELVRDGLPEKSRLYEHYEDVMEFLNNGKPKILKYWDGRIRLISITTPPNNTSEEHFDKHTITFSYTEIGSIYSNRDMKAYGFLDIGEEWWNES